LNCCPGEETDIESTSKRSWPWPREEQNILDFQNPISSVGLEQWMGLQQRHEVVNPSIQLEFYRSMAAAALQEFRGSGASKEICAPQQTSQSSHMQVNNSQQPQQQEHHYQPQIQWQQLPKQIQCQQQQLASQQTLLQQNTQLQQLQENVPIQHLQQQVQPNTMLQQLQQQQVLIQQLQQQRQALQQLQQLQQPLPDVKPLQQWPVQQSQLLQQQQPSLLLQQQQPAQLQQQLQQPLQALTPHKVLPMPTQQLQHQPQLQQYPLPSQLTENNIQRQELQQQEQTIMNQQSAQQHVPSRQQSQVQQMQHPSPSQHLGQKQSPEQPPSRHPQQSTQSRAAESQMQLLSSRPLAACNMPVPTRSRSGFTESDVSFCSTSTSATSYPPQNILTMSQSGTATSGEKSLYGNMSKPAQVDVKGTTYVANNLPEPPVTPWLTSSKESSQNDLQAIPNFQSAEIETQSFENSFSTVQANAGVQQGFSILPNPSTSFWFGNTSQHNDIQDDPRNSILFGVNIENHSIDPSTSSPVAARGFNASKEVPTQVSAESMITSFSTSKEVQPQISSTSMLSSHSAAIQDLPDSDVASTIELEDNSLLQRGSFQKPPQPMRTFTKVCFSFSGFLLYNIQNFKRSMLATTLGIFVIA